MIVMRERVLQVLIDSEEPLYLAQIAEKLNETSQLVQYHLSRLVDEGFLLTFVEDRKRYYTLQPVQYKYPPAALYDVIRPLLEDMAPHIQCNQASIQPSEVLANNLILLLERFAIDIDELFENEKETTEYPTFGSAEDTS